MRAMNEPPAQFALSNNDKLNPLWLRLRIHMEEQLRIARIKNDDEKLTEQATAALRGRIATLKGLISLGDTSPVIPD